MAMRCSTWKIVLFILFFIVVVQFSLQLRIAYLEKANSQSQPQGNTRDQSINVNRIVSRVESVVRDQRRNVALPTVRAPPRTPPPETIIKPFIPASPACNVTLKEALSAIARAQSEDCRGELRKVACAHQQDMLYWKNFTRTCPVTDNPAIDANMTFTSPHPDVPRVRILFMITVHGRAVRQVHRVIKALYHVNHYYYIHVDARSYFMHAEMLKLAAQYDNVRITPWRLATIWGGASLQQMLLRAMQDAHTMTDWHWDFFVNLSESDYPFKNFTYMVEFLTAWRSYNFLRAHGKASPRFIRKQGLDQTFYECEHHMWRIGPRTLPPDIHIDGGSDWFMLNRQYVDYLVSSQDKIVLALKHMFHYTLLPAESFFHTLLRNGPLCQTMVKNNLRLANWKRTLGCRCQYKAIVDWCGCSPNDFLTEDFKKIQGMNDKLFGRKFEAIVNQDVINKLDFFLFGPYPEGTPGLNSYWENIYNANDFGESYNDVKFTVYRSMARMLRRRLSGCISSSAAYHIEDAHVLQRDDKFRALLVTIRFENGHESSVFEVEMMPAIDSSSTVTLKPFQSISVGSNFDKKEYMFRDHGNMHGLTTPITFVVRYASGKGATVILELVNPAGKVVKHIPIGLRADWSIADQVLQWEGEKEPGVWRVNAKATVDSSATEQPLGSVQFALYPQEMEKTKEVVDEASLKSIGLGHMHTKLTTGAGSIQTSLQQLTDSITKQAWTIGNVCSVAESSCSGVVQCSATPWSSLSPDPKSQLLPVQKDGRIR